MSNFHDKLNEFVGQEIFLKDVNNSSYGGILKEVGEDFCVLAIAKRQVFYCLSQIVSIEPRMMAPNEPASGKPPDSPG